MMMKDGKKKRMKKERRKAKGGEMSENIVKQD
jgi:hypothetical protein